MNRCKCCGRSEFETSFYVYLYGETLNKLDNQAANDVCVDCEPHYAKVHPWVKASFDPRVSPRVGTNR
jgi:hypothetical protein